MTRSPSGRTIASAAALAFIFASGTIGSAAAQVGPSPVPGFSQNRNQPINIESDHLEVKDKEKIATFTGDVRATQGDVVLECKVLVVFYDQDNAARTANASTSSSSTPATTAAPAGTGQIRRIEAKGGVVVTQNDQVATGDEGVFEMKSNEVTLIGNVVVKQGINVIRGDRLWVDLTTGVARVESRTADGKKRVQALFNPNQPPSSPPANAAPQQRQRGSSATPQQPRRAAERGTPANNTGRRVN